MPDSVSDTGEAPANRKHGLCVLCVKKRNNVFRYHEVGKVLGHLRNLKASWSSVRGTA